MSIRKSVKLNFIIVIICLILFLTSCQNISTPKLEIFNKEPIVFKIMGNDFQWGVSSAGYQCEGGDQYTQWHFWELAGKTEDINGKSVDFYNRYPEDIKLAKDIGINAFRLSIEWARIFPNKDQVDYNELNYYHKLINTIKSNGMIPLVTLMHFTHPQWLMNNNDSDGLTGWEDPDTIDEYLKYVQLVVSEFKNDVKFWLTFNEPNVWVVTGYLAGATPPGKRNPIAFFRVVRNILQAHSRAYDLIHSIEPQAMVSSNVYQLSFKFFKNNKISQFTEQEAQNFCDTNWFFESLNTGVLPVEEKVLFPTNTRFSSGVSLFKKLDYIAFDYYYPITSLKDIPNFFKPWLEPIYPEGIYKTIMDYHKKYNKPIIIAENGLCTENEKPRPDKWTRGAHIVNHIYHMQRAIKDGANVLGYYHWSITDNYEWGSFTPRFGLYRVDVLKDPTLKRIPTDGVWAYKDVISNGGVTLELLKKYPSPN